MVKRTANNDGIIIVKNNLKQIHLNINIKNMVGLKKNLMNTINLEQLH